MRHGALFKQHFSWFTVRLTSPPKETLETTHPTPSSVKTTDSSLLQATHLEVDIGVGMGSCQQSTLNFLARHVCCVHNAAGAVATLLREVQAAILVQGKAGAHLHKLQYTCRAFLANHLHSPVRAKVMRKQTPPLSVCLTETGLKLLIIVSECPWSAEHIAKDASSAGILQATPVHIMFLSYS
eukprot:1158087-Pelagomonas_calceolata.AAC.7